MARTEIDGDQVQDESLTGDDILDGSVQRKDIDVSTSGQSIITRIFPDTGIEFTSSTGADSGTGDVTIRNRSLNFGQDFALEEKTSSETTTGGSFVTYSVLNFDVTDTTGTNVYRVNADFLWSHNSAANDIRVRVLLDGAQIGEELRIEPKDPNNDQRYQNNILEFPVNLSNGTHSFALQYRPASGNRVSRMYRSKLEVWRVI